MRALPVLLLGLLTLPAFAAPGGGRFTVYERGREAGREEVVDGPDGLRSHVTLSGGRELRLEILFHPPSVVIEEEGKRRTFEPPPEEGLLVLAEPFAAPWLLVADRYDLRRGGRQAFRAFFPRFSRTGRVVVTRREDQPIEIDGRVHLATRLLAVPDHGETANLWLDASGRLLVLARSVAGLSAVRGTRVVVGLKPGSDPPDPPGVTSLRIRFAADGIVLAGTFTRPRSGEGPFPAALLLSGSGPQDRNGNAPGTELCWSPLHSFAVALAKEGVASLRYDDRGVGKSGGLFADAGFTELLADARCALGYLRSREDVRPDRVAVLGHSEGALLAAKLAAGTGVRAVVLVGAPAEPLDRILLSQFAARLRRERVEPPRARRVLAELRAYFEHVRLSERDVVHWSGRTQNVRWLRQHMDLLPREIYHGVTVPALVLHGAHDLQVPAAQGERVARWIERAEFHLLPGLDHFLVPGRGTIEDYADAVRHVDPGALTRVSGWLKRQLAR